MDGDPKSKADYFQFRWGVKEWDVGFTTIPNPVLKHYSRVPWVDKGGKRGYGIANQEVLCIIHIASFHYESEQGEARPAIPTIRQRMGYKKDDSISELIKSLEHKGLLIVERRSGKCNIYSLGNFSRAIVDMDNPPIPVGGSIPVGDILKDPPTPVGDNPPTPVGMKNKTKEEKPKVKKKIIDPLSFDLDRLTLKNKKANYATPAHAGGSDSAAEAALLALYHELDSEPPRQGTASWKDELEIIGQALRGRGVTDSDVAREAGRRFGEANQETPQFANPHLSTFPAAFGMVVGRVKKKTAQHTAPRRQPESALLSQEALQERRAAQPPLPEDDAVGQGVKAQLEVQMGRPEFQRLVQPARFTCNDGVLVITAPDDFTRNWLENRLAVTIKRALAGVTDGPEKIVFEVSE